VDVSNPATPTEVGFYDTPGVAGDVTVAEGYAYVVGNSGESAYDGRLRVADVSTPSNPTEVGFYDTPGQAVGVAATRGYVYVADGDGGLRVVDVSTPTNPTEVGFCETPGWAKDVAVAGGYAYVVGNSGDPPYGGWLRVVDVSTPASPTEVGFYEYDIPHSTGRIQDLEECRQPIPRRSPNGPSGARKLLLSPCFWSKNALYRPLRSAVPQVLDAPCSPSSFSLTQVGFYYYDTPGYPQDPLGVAVVGGYAYIAAGALRVVDVSTPANPTEVGFCDTLIGDDRDVAVAEGYAYVAEWYPGLRVVDVSTPANPTQVGLYDIPGYALCVAVAGGYAYVGTEPGLRVLDVSTPANSTEVGFYNTPGHGSGVAVAGGYAYVADGDGGLFILRYTGRGSAFSISGHVRDNNDNPISGVTVSASAGSSATTDANGDYIITDVTTGTHTLTPSKSGYTFSPATRTIGVPPGATGQDFTGSSIGPPADTPTPIVVPTIAPTVTTMEPPGEAPATATPAPGSPGPCPGTAGIVLLALVAGVPLSFSPIARTKHYPRV
jgi:hypothetical protein